MGKGQLDNASTGYPQLLKRMHAAGHQVASHTWTHQNLSALTVQQRQNQMYYNEMAFRNVLGFFPTYMRPPYSECNNETQAMMYDMGYHVVYYNIDSSGKLNPTLWLRRSHHFTTFSPSPLIFLLALKFLTHPRLPVRRPYPHPKLKRRNKRAICNCKRHRRLPSRFHRHKPRHPRTDCV